ncbi:putative endonuclease LCL3 OS=Laccaria bicolor (strain S238N-H82 / ATCC MYA-4686) GN=LCL3 PE=3 SV=1 [Rhizoctonia solani AG-1 IB]|uniref:Putative endonuclease LCL3 n=1 Tax=Thanatephorus cucumeris (strain AG1-IB / isolate 7/3/14) TaxID=1108050 RepID=A0A0B7FXR4_THACB|nr:putative endonuclease LCL3 OS=Laccaria bicolor (strain S238N-H82 / ATCC MYA-4686) GN=LCL3 PE=3 SV=1 [Rhizoctonia solani AG-1 IB]
MHKSSNSDLPLSKQLNDLKSLYASDPRAHKLVLWTAGATSIIGLASFFAGSRFIQASRRIPNADWVHPGLLVKRPLIRGVVTRVGDADNFRKVPVNSRDLANETIHIRINAVDAPEGAHFGREAQPKSHEALQWLKNQIGGKTIWCRPLRRDHHGRIVASCYLPPRILPSSIFKGRHLSMEMLRAGWATVYEQGGAEYDPYTKQVFLRVEGEAKSAKRGIWEKGRTLKETPAEYKRRHTAAEAAAAGSK